MRVPRIQGPRRVAAADFAQVCLQIGNKPKAAQKKKTSWCFSWSWSSLILLLLQTTVFFPPWPSMAPRRGSLGAQRGTGRCCCFSGSLLDLAPQQHYRGYCTARIGWCHFKIDFHFWGEANIGSVSKKNHEFVGLVYRFIPLVQERLAQFGSIRGGSVWSVLRGHREVSGKSSSWNSASYQPPCVDFFLAVHLEPSKSMWVCKFTGGSMTTGRISMITDIVVLHMYNMCICVYYIYNCIYIYMSM